MPNGRFYFTERLKTNKRFEDFFNKSTKILKSKNIEEKIKNLVVKLWAFYIRSSEPFEGNKIHLENQYKVLSENYPNPKFVFKDSASGLNENRVGLKKMIEKVKQGEITDIAIIQKNRLSRFKVW